MRARPRPRMRAGARVGRGARPSAVYAGVFQRRHAAPSASLCARQPASQREGREQEFQRLLCSMSLHKKCLLVWEIAARGRECPAPRQLAPGRPLAAAIPSAFVSPRDRRHPEFPEDSYAGGSLPCTPFSPSQSLGRGEVNRTRATPLDPPRSGLFSADEGDCSLPARKVGARASESPS